MRNNQPIRSLGLSGSSGAKLQPNDYGAGVAVAAAWAAFSLSFATFAVACWSRSASFCRFGFGVGVGLTLASSEREQAPRIKQQESEIVVRKIFMMKSRRACRFHC